MSSKSDDYMDIRVWIEDIIRSCQTYQQTLVAEKLIELFIQQMRYRYLHPSILWSIESQLKYQLWVTQSVMNKND